jgi:hypothetical protein
MVVLGMIMHRIDVSIVAFARPEGMGYFPSWEEFAVSFGIVAGAMLIFLFFVENLNVFDDVRGHSPEHRPTFDPEAMRSFMPGILGFPRRYSTAALVGGAVALLFLPVGGVEDVPVPVKGPRSVEAVIKDRGESEIRELNLASTEDAVTSKVLLLDANRNGEVVLFDHDDHAKRLGGERSCETCHHLNKPLDENTSCSECHTDMYEPRSVFDHESHVLGVGGDNPCLECHKGDSEVKSYETVTECSDCHRAEIADRAFVEKPEPHWKEAPGYMEAMHSLCVECHKREALKAPAEAPENLDRCMTCHNVDWREEVRDRMPKPRSQDRMAGSETSGSVSSSGGG